ncbi:MAG: hypothetical protein HQL89_14605 [Magnetococcales bacterium]|nr:hypothetical protein [Magnetococcales bacterium]
MIPYKDLFPLLGHPNHLDACHDFFVAGAFDTDPSISQSIVGSYSSYMADVLARKSVGVVELMRLRSQGDEKLCFRPYPRLQGLQGTPSWQKKQS